MLHKVVEDLRGDAIVARDGRVGSLEDVYFDDERWAVRYFVVDTGNWLPGRQVLISPALNLTREQVRNAQQARVG